MAREIERSEWTTFFERLGRQREGWLVTLDCDRIGCPFRDLPLRGVAIGERTIEIFVTGADGSHLNHIVRGPVRVTCEETAEGGDVVTMTNADGARTVVAFRPAGAAGKNDRESESARR